jgi:hypothetical protein
MNELDTIKTSDMYNINAIHDDSNLRITMERYSYNLWALFSLIGIIITLRMIDKIYLYNIILIFIITAFFIVYFTYMK